MLRRILASALIAGCLALPVVAGSVGMFAGRVVDAAAENPPGKWIYVKGRGATLRRVEISQARYEYSDAVPQAVRAPKPADDLREGAVIQVAAEQDSSGEWIAKTILFLRLSKQKLVQSSAR
jgi:hypothetical protein